MVRAAALDDLPKPSASAVGALQEIFLVLRASCRVDFAHYKPELIRRRIARRLALRRVDTLQDYLKLLRTQPEELNLLFEDLLITVTEFFRDPEVFKVLEHTVIPEILNGLLQDRPARVWVPGCASGHK